MSIDPRSLHSFLLVCREGSITAAAKRMNISQPAVSVTIAELERVLKVKLLDRSRGGAVPTAAGQALLRRAEAMDALLDAATQEATLNAQGVAGPLVVGGTPGALTSLIPGAIEILGETHPAYAMRILERGEPELMELLRQGRIEVAIVTTGTETMPPDITEHGILRDSCDLIVGVKNQALPDRLALRDLVDRSWVLPDAVGMFRRQVEAVFVSAEVRMPARAIRSGSILSTKAIVRQTDYLTILPQRVVEAELASGQLRAIELTDARIVRAIGIRLLTGRPLSPMANAFVDAIRALGESMPGFEAPK